MHLATDDPSACALFRRCLILRSDEDWYRFHQLFGSAVRVAVRNALLRLRCTPNRDQIDEYLQELYVHLLSSDPRSFRGRSEEELWAFLSATVRHLALDRSRTHERRKGLEKEFWGLLSWAAKRPRSPERRVVNREERERFFRICRWQAGSAPGDVRLALKLRILWLAFFDGMSSREIAHQLREETALRCEPAPREITPHQINTIIHRLRRRLAPVGVSLPRRAPARLV